MIIDQASYDSYKSMDHNLIVNILETSVSVYDVSAPTPRQIDRVRFKNPTAGIPYAQQSTAGRKGYQRSDFSV